MHHESHDQQPTQTTNKTTGSLWRNMARHVFVATNNVSKRTEVILIATAKWCLTLAEY